MTIAHFESETQYRKLYNSVPVGLYRSSPDGRMLDINHALLHMTGYPDRETFFAIPIQHHYVNPADRQRWLALFTEQDVVNDFEFPFRRYNGDVIWIRDSARAIRNGQGEVVYFEGVAIDISAEKRTEQALSASEARFQAMAQGSDDIITIIDANGIITYQSPAAERIFGSRPEENIGQSFFHNLTAEQQAYAYEGFQLALTVPGKTLSLEMPYQHKDGSWRTIEATGSNLLDDPAVAGIIVTSRDITARRQAEQALKKQNTLLHLLQKITEAANEASDPVTAYQTAVELVCSHIGWPVGHVYETVTGQAELTATNIWHIAEPEKFQLFRDVTMNDPLSAPQGLIFRTYRRRRPVWIPDVTEDLLFVRGRTTPEIGVRAAFAFPVLVAKEVVAVLEFFSDQPQETDELLLEVMAQVGTQLGRVAERARSEQALRESETRLRTVLDNLPVGVYLTDETGLITYGNPAGQQIWAGVRYVGVAQYGEYKGWWLDSGKRIEAEEWALARAALYGETSLDELIEIECFDGTHKTISNSAVPLYDTQQRLRGGAVAVRDVTDRHRAQRALAQAAEDLARSNAELQQFAYVASHDLQEPLRMVSSYLQLIQRRYQGQLDADADEFIHFAVDGANRMKILINDLLAYSRIGTRDKPLAPVALDAILQQVLQNLAVAITEANATITTDPLPTLLADVVQLEQLLQNLIGNAIKFRGEQPPHIHIAARRDPDGWLFSVQDNGIGFSPEYHDRIFTVFQRLHTTAHYAGTGIGLAICKKIVQRHGGRIWAESTPAAGTTFYFSWPEQPGPLGRSINS